MNQVTGTPVVVMYLLINNLLVVDFSIVNLWLTLIVDGALFVLYLRHILHVKKVKYTMEWNRI